MSKKPEKIKVIHEGGRSMEIQSTGVLTTMHNRDIRLSLLDDKGKTLVIFRNKDNDADQPAVAHRTQFNGKVRVSELGLSLEGLMALRDSIDMYVKYGFKRNE